jgi:hypothetical protein
MSPVLLGFLLVWAASFVIFALLIWRAPMIEEMLERPEADASAQNEGAA